MRAPDVLPASAVLVCADPAALDLSSLAADLPPRLHAATATRRQEYLAGRWCARAALERLGVPRQQIAVGAPDSPPWPAGVVGSITHTRGYAAAAVARVRDVCGLGLDAEPVIRSARDDVVRARLATGRELDTIMSQAALDMPEAVTLLVSAKEALYKCLFPHVGRAFDYLETSIDSVDPATRSFRAALLVPLSPRWGVGAVFHGRFERIEDVMHAGITLS